MSEPLLHALPSRLAGYARRGVLPGGHSNLSLALFLLPRDRRADAFLFHDFCRLVDDLADSGNEPASLRRERLNAWIAALEPGGEPQLPSDFSEMIRRRNLSVSLLREIVLGMRMDTDTLRYPAFEDLHKYCWRVASAVGLISTTLFGAQGEEVEHYASELGIALQLTNILRDVAEDAAMNRIYLPSEDLERFSVTEEEILDGKTSPRMTHLLNHQAERADSYFARAELAWSELSKNQKRLLRPARLMSTIYRNLLLMMHKDRYDVLYTKYRVSTLSKIYSALSILLQPES